MSHFKKINDDSIVKSVEQSTAVALELVNIFFSDRIINSTLTNKHIIFVCDVNVNSFTN